ncbi:11512_t:CDS:2, partial [Racocetra persica]
RMIRENKEDKKKPDVPFNVIYSCDFWEFHRTLVELYSFTLIKILKTVLLNNKEIFNKEPKINARDLYHVLDKMHEAADNEQAHDSKIQVNHLIRFLEQEYDQVTKTRERMKMSKKVSFDMLWVFYTANQEVW